MKTFEEILEERKKKKGTTPTVNDNSTRKSFDEILAERGIVRNKNNSSSVNVASTQKATEEPKWYDNFLQLGDALSDGWQFGDITKTLLGTNTDMATNLLSGIVGWGEEAIKAGAAAAGTVTEKLGMDDTTEKIREFVATDLYDANTVSKQILSSNFIGTVPGLSGLGNAIKTIFTLEDFLNSKKEVDNGFGGKTIVREDNSIFADDADALLQSVGESGAKMGISALSGGLPISDIITGITVYGSQAEQAIKEDATFSKATGSALISAAAEILFEKLSGGIKFGGVTLDDGLTRLVSKNISNVALKNGINFFKDFTGEALEEVLTEFVSKLGTSLYKEEDLTNILFSEDALQDYIKAGFSGGLMGGLFNAPNALKGTASGVDYKTGLTKTEQAVFDKEYNDRIAEATKDGKKASAKDKSNIYNSVMDDIEKGRISIDTIESVLGGETYKQYQSAVEKDNQMKELQKEYDSLYQMKSGDKSDAQADHQAELKQQLEDYKNNSQLTQLKDKLSKEVSEMAKVSKLSESYNEKTRRSQAFETDLSQYDKKHQGTYKRAIESGILNNTNRTHEFVDLLAKLEADKGVLFDFTNNAKIKETGFAIEGKQVNGYVQGNNIAINIDSTSALNKVVGHEIAHVLEGTELYTELANAVKELATTKGEYDSKLQSITKLYEGVEGANIENELTADLIGEYLFTDSEFINRLSAEKPTLFQKIFDEIKYLCKVATAGSKEAKQLEKVKKTFEEAYRQKNNTATDDGVKYSMAGVYSKTYDNSLALKAEQMLFSGVDSETVRQETGWYKGYDGEWRYEIDDSKCELIENPNLEKHEDEFVGTYFTGKVSDVLNHNDLFEAYPQLKDIKIVIQPTDVGLRGRYEGGSEKYITLNLELFKRHTKEYDDIIKNGTTEIKSIEQTPEYKEYNKWHTDDDLLNMDAEEWLVEEDKAREKFYSSELGKRYYYLMWGRKDIQTLEFGWSKSAKEVLMHELQHAIQEIEGFTGGSSSEYWQRKLDSGFTIKSAEQKDDLKNAEKEYYAIMKKDPYFFSVMSELAKSKPNIPRGKIDFNTFEKIEEDPVEWQRYDEIRDRLEKEYGSKAVMDFLRISDKVKNLRDKSYTAEEAYMQTAGEVEARDTARRLNLNAEQRKNTRPDIDRTDVVFADNSSVGYSIARTKKMSWDEQINGYYKDNNIKIKHSDTLIALPNTPKYMQSDEIEDLPFAIPLSVISKAQKGKNDDHHISDKTIKKLGIAIENPIAIIHDTNRNSAFIITDLIENGKPIVATFVLNDKFDGDDVHRCSSIHKRTDIKKYLENLSNAEIFVENKNKLVNLCREVDILDRLQNNNKLISISLTQKNNNVKEYSLSNANEDIAPVGNNVYGEDIKLQTTSAEDIAPIGEDVARKTTPSESNIPDDYAPTADDVQKQNAPKIDLFVKSNKTVENEQATVFEETTPAEQSTITIDEKAVERLTRKVIDGLDIGKTKKNRTAIGEIIKSFGDNYSATTKDDLYNAVKGKFETVYVDSVINKATDLIYNNVTEHREATSKVDKVTKDIESANISNKVKTEIKNQLTSAYEKIEAEFNIDKNNLVNELNARKSQLETDTADKNQFFKKYAGELYSELKQLKKGVRASEDLSYLLNTLDSKNRKPLVTALINAKNAPEGVVNENSEIERVVRELLNEKFDSYVDELNNFDSTTQEELEKLESKAEDKRNHARLAVNGKLVREIMDAEQVSIMGNTSLWKDKSKGFMYKTETEKRNFFDIVRDKNGKKDTKKAQALYDYFMGTYNHNEAELKREASVIQKKFADLKLNKHEDVFVQMKGEFLHNPHTELTQHDIDTFLNLYGKNIDEAKVDKAIDMARETYDSLIERMNEVLVAHGMKPIEYRRGYFPHFSEVEKSKFAKFAEKFLNWKTQNNDIPTDIAGLTESFKPNRSWQSFNKRRISDETDYSFSKGFDRYLQGSLDWIYHIDDIMKRRVFENRIRYDHSDNGIKEQIQEIYKNNEFDTNEKQEQIDLVFREAQNPLNNFIIDFRTRTNTLAGKKSSMDRGMEEFTNRKFYSTATNISNRVTGNIVAGSISSALTNFIPITQSWGEVSPINSFKAMGETIKSTFKDDGTINKSDFLTNRLNNVEKLYQTGWDKVNKVAGCLMEAIDSFTSQTVWRSKYLENMSKGMSEAEAIKNADEFAEGLIAGRSRGNMPTIFDSKNLLIKTMTAFQLEVNNQYRYMFKDMPQNLKDESVAKLVKGYATMFIGAYAYNALYSFFTGRDAAFDPIRIIQELIGDLTDDEEDEPADIIMDFTDNIIDELPFVGGILGDGGRVPLSSALPYGGVREAFEGTITDASEGDLENLTKEWLSSVGAYVLAPVAGGQIKKTAQGLSMFDDDLPIAGSYTDSGKLRFKVEETPGNIAQAALFGQYASKTARQYFDEEHTPLSSKKTEELSALDVSMEEYWEYQKGLKKLGEDAKLAEKVDFIANLEGFETWQKNIMANNLTDRKTPIDLTGYEAIGDFEEFDFYMKNPEKYAVAKAVGGYDSYMEYSKRLSNITSEKDSKGKTVSGSRKKKVARYINNLDIEFGEKMILYKNEFKGDDTYNAQIVEYLNGRNDITYQEKTTILTELGFKVLSDGTVRW